MVPNTRIDCIACGAPFDGGVLPAAAEKYKEQLRQNVKSLGGQLTMNYFFLAIYIGLGGLFLYAIWKLYTIFS